MLVELAKHDIHGVSGGLGQQHHIGRRVLIRPESHHLHAQQDCQVNREGHQWVLSRARIEATRIPGAEQRARCRASSSRKVRSQQ